MFGSFNIHPPLASFPFALLSIVVILEIILLFKNYEILRKAVFVNLTIAVLSVLITFFSGYQAESLYHSGLTSMSIINQRADNDVVNSAIEFHHSMGRMLLFAIIGCYCFFLAFVKASVNKTLLRISYYIILLICFCLVLLTGYYGSRLVFDYGVGVL